MSEQTEERASIDSALAMWEQKGPTSLTVALVTDALYGARDRLAAVEALAVEVRGARHVDGSDMSAAILAALRRPVVAADPADTTR